MTVASLPDPEDRYWASPSRRRMKTSMAVAALGALTVRSQTKAATPPTKCSDRQGFRRHFSIDDRRRGVAKPLRRRRFGRVFLRSPLSITVVIMN